MSGNFRSFFGGSDVVSAGGGLKNLPPALTALALAAPVLTCAQVVL
jgi:hypothetical protein